jgi:pyrroline-5-carboxylate reductase
MAAAMARGWAAADEGPQAMLFCDLDAERAEALASETGGEARASAAEVRDDADLVVLGVKPHALAAVAGELEGRAPAILSMLAATPIAAITKAFPGVPAIRVMPNQPVEVRSGVVCYVDPDDSVPADLASAVIRLLGQVGMTVPLSEDLIDAAMAVMSCAPAYVAQFAQALAAEGVREGLDPELAADLVTGTVGGTADLLTTKDPAAVRRSVAPPGGATEAGLAALADNGFDEAIAAAVRASLERFR